MLRRKIFAIAAVFLCAISSRPQTSAPVALRIIVVQSEDEAKRILERLHNGEDFAAIAKQESIDQTASRDGSLGDLQPSELRTELREAAAKLTPGALSGPIQTGNGYAILQELAKPNASVSDNEPSAPTSLLPVMAQGQVRYSPDISGYDEALLARRTAFTSLPSSQQDEKAACESMRQDVPQAREDVLQTIDVPGVAPGQKAMGYYTVGQLYAYGGDLDNAIRTWEKGYAITQVNHLPLAQKMKLVLATGYLHRASLNDHATENGTDPSHIFPGKPGSLHPSLADVQKAIEYLSAYLQTDAGNGEARWLLNVAYMTAGTYPDQVLAQYLIPPSAFASKENVGRFVDISPAAGVKYQTTAGGLIVDDFDNDGLLDIVTSQVDDCSPMHFFHNNGDGTFSDRSVQSGLSKQYGGLNIIQADYNNDGCVDILVLRGGWEFARPLSLLRNNCNGTFTDVTRQSGLGVLPTSTNSAVWLDVDNDGKLDLFVGNENSPSQLFLNKGNGTFADISHAAGVDRVVFAKGVVSADYDGDGYPDIYVSNFGGDNLLFHNNGDRTFTEVGKQAHVQEPRQSFGAAFFDYDNDGLPDLYVSTFYNSVEEVAKTYSGLPNNAETLKLYRNLGNGTFEDISVQVGLNKVYMPMGFNFGDIDNDGFLDLYLGSGNPSFLSKIPNVLLRNDGARKFVDVTTSSGTGAMEKGHGIAFADFTNSGHEDIAAVMGGAVPGDRHSFRLFQNPGNGNDWLTVHLVGTKTNRGAVGARLKVTVTNEGVQRSIWRTVGSGGSFGAQPLEQHIGLGKAAKIDRLEIFWPVSRTHQVFADIAADQAIKVVELSDSFTKLQRRTFSFATSALEAKSR